MYETTNKIIMGLMGDRRIVVQLAAGCHSSLRGNRADTWYHVVHANANVIWVVNPDTNYALTIPNASVNVLCIDDITPSPRLPAAGKADHQYILWSPESSLPPSVVHNNYDTAKKVAADMARKHRGNHFNVCEIRGCAYLPPSDVKYEEY